jgi:hypothetical protein
MGSWYLYADAESKLVLESSCRKILLVGGCFGTSNFGDILQLKGAVNFHKSMGWVNPIPVFSMESLCGTTHVGNLKKAYGVGAILFVSQQRYDAAHAGFVLQSQFCAVEALHLYGGGFLNGKWGHYVISITEFLLKNLAIETYGISGQQVDLEFAQQTAGHIHNFQPGCVGVRDDQSSQLLRAHGVASEFSFDDAYDELAIIASNVPKSKNERALVHLNVSSYTDNAEKEHELIRALRTIEAYCSDGIVAFNAFNEKGFEVVDTIRTIAWLENDFPFHDYIVVDGPALAREGRISNFDALDVGIALSCSYHVALFMHLLGVPCYLNASNSFYEQKRIALDCPKTLEQFLEEKRVPDYSGRIESRKFWLQKLQEYFLGLTPKNNDKRIVEFDNTGIIAKFQDKRRSYNLA